eukprot:6949857-Ditylum_brightwellii.AAC.1
MVTALPNIPTTTLVKHVNTSSPPPMNCLLHANNDGSSSFQKQSIVAFQSNKVSPSRTALASASSSICNNNDENTNKQKFEKGMTLSLFFTYFTVMGAKCALPSTLSLLTSSAIFTHPSQMSSLLTYSTMAIACGKFLLGPFIDAIGGIASLQIALSALSILLGVISFSGNYRVFATCWIGVDFIFSATWAACLHAIHQSFDEGENNTVWSRKIGILAIAARIGNAAAFMGFASVLGWSSARQLGGAG